MCFVVSGDRLRGLWILILVDALVHQLVNFWLFPALAEGGQVVARVAIEHQFIMYHRIPLGQALADAALRERRFTEISILAELCVMIVKVIASTVGQGRAARDCGQ